MLLDLNTKATGRIPLIVAWASAFALQAILRSTFHGTPLAAPLLPMTGFAFILFTRGPHRGRFRFGPTAG